MKDERKDKVTTFAIDILKECQNKGFTVSEVENLIKELSCNAGNAIYLQKQCTAFHLDKPQEIELGMGSVFNFR